MDNLRALKEIKRYKNGEFELLTDLVAREVSFIVYLNGERLVSIASLPEHLLELGVGFLFSEGIVLQREELTGWEFSQAERYVNFQVQIPEERVSSFFRTGEKTSGCGSALSSGLKGKRAAFPVMHLQPEAVLDQMRQFQIDSDLFRQTGGVHKAGLVINEELKYTAEDIGRHNAVDKVGGMAVMAENSLQQSYLLCSGRISSEIVKKSVRLGIPLIVSQSAATSAAISLGWKYKIFLIGFARGRRFNLYTGFEENIF